MIAYLGVVGVIVSITMTFVLVIPYRDPQEKYTNLDMEELIIRYKELSTKTGKASGAIFAVLPAILSSFNALFSKIVGELIYNVMFYLVLYSRIAEFV